MSDLKPPSRDRSASPAPRPKKQKTGGFKWKESKTKSEDKSAEKGYRERSPRRARSPPKGEADLAPKATNGTASDEKATDTAPKDDTLNESKPTPSVADKFGTSYKPRAPPTAAASDSNPTTQTTAEKPSKPKKSKKPSTHPTGPLIIVNVNDRLGTKAAIPCLASDSVKAFKAIVAARIGRQPHEIMIKRQGERPFKDALSLEDYGVGNGVQLDLEVDTGD